MVKPRGVRKGETPNWNVGRKKAEPGRKHISRSLSLQKWMWDELEKMAEQQGTTKNKVISNLVEIFLKK